VIIKNNIIRNNSAVGLYPYGGGISLMSSGLTYILSNKIIDNEVIGTYASGGGIDVFTNLDEVIINSNYIVGNESQLGGGIDLYNWGASISIGNNLIVDNTGHKGGGVLVDSDVSIQNTPLLINNTIINNSATFGGGIHCEDFSPEAMNSIIWGNTSNSGGQIWGIAMVTYSDVEGGYTGTGNIDLNPEFIPGKDFYPLVGSSPCIDAGNPDPNYNDAGTGTPRPPALGTLRNDMGHCGGPASRWMQEWPVPVELTSFTATTQFGKVTLYWTTATELNNLGFEIERALSSTTPLLNEWIRIGFVLGKGTTTEPQAYSYVDDISRISATSLSYRLKQIDFDGSYEYSDEVLVDNPAPVNYDLGQNYPNPFNPITTINYSLPLKSQVRLVVYNSLGESVMQLVNENKEAGTYRVEFDATSLPSGVYFYQIKARNYNQVKKMILMK
jgi:predicted outer membrane repeat protein